MNTAGGNDAGWVQLPDEEHRFTEEQVKEFAARWEAARDPSVRDVLAQLDRIETMIGALNARIDADEVARG